MVFFLNQLAEHGDGLITMSFVLEDLPIDKWTERIRRGKISIERRVGHGEHTMFSQLPPLNGGTRLKRIVILPDRIFGRGNITWGEVLLTAAGLHLKQVELHTVLSAVCNIKPKQLKDLELNRLFFLHRPIKDTHKEIGVLSYDSYGYNGYDGSVDSYTILHDHLARNITRPCGIVFERDFESNYNGHL